MSVFANAQPQLYVGDIARSVEFYTRKLAFAVASTYGDPPFYAQVYREYQANGAEFFQTRTAGRPNLHRARSGRESGSVRRAG
jgi:catechol 2,3-dioxygenase-like lactoylglutathione lyase family enzyme